MATPNLSYQNKYSSTLSAGITATDTTISITSLPTPSEGYLVIEPDSSTAWEVIYYTSKTGSAVVCPSVAAGRGVGGSTAASHSSGATVRMDSTAEMFSTLQDATGLTGLHRYGTDGVWFDFVASGCVWTGDSLGTNRNASMTSGVVYINGRRHTVASVTARTFTASKDTYVDLLYSTTDNVATLVYTEVSNNAASPALASNSVRLAIIVTGATTIAAAGSINQGQEDRILPIASSIAYSVTDSLGNLICPRDPNRKLLGLRQIVSSFAPGTTAQTLITGLNCPVIIPTGRKVKASFYSGVVTDATASQVVTATIYEGIFGSGGTAKNQANGNTTNTELFASHSYTPSSSSLTYTATIQSTSGNPTVGASATAPTYLMVELL